MSNDNRRSDVAVFIDFENIYVSVRDKLDVNPNFELIMDRCEDFGRVVIARAYADWYRYPRVTSALYANGVEPMYVPTYYYDRDLGRTGRAIKNSVDMNLCIDAMKTLYTNPNIGKFVLCTGDRDFIPLVNSIRQQGKEVIIIGIGGAASSHLAQSADEFIFYEALIGKKTTTLLQDQPRARMPEKGRDNDYEQPDTPAPPRERESPRDREREPVREPAPVREPVREPAPVREPVREPAPAQPDIFDVLVQAVMVARERDFVCSFGSLKLLMKELTSGEFREDKYRDSSGRPFAKFKDFVMEAERRGKVQVFTNGAVNEVFLPGEDPYKLSRFAMDLKEEAPTAPRPTPVAEELRNGDSRQSIGGRRRRRRSRGGRGQGVDGQPATQNGELGEEFEELDLSFAEQFDSAVEGPGDSDAMFEELLDRLGEEEHRRETLESFDALELLDAPVGELPTLEDSPVELAEPVEEVQEISELPDPFETAEPPELPFTEEVPVEPPVEALVEQVEPVSAEVAEPPTMEPVAAGEPAEETGPIEFSDVEWSLLVNLMSKIERALSFVQIHDLLRESRNSAGINRTNEELRTLIKQAINTGKLVRSGKGTRVNYRLAAPEETPAAEVDVPVEAPSLVEVVAATAEEPETAEPGAAVVEEPSPVEIVAATAEAPIEEPKPAKRRGTRKKKTEEPVAAPAIETPAVTEPVVEAPAAEVAPAPEPVEEPKPAKRRSTRKKKTDEAPTGGQE